MNPEEQSPGGSCWCCLERTQRGPLPESCARGQRGRRHLALCLRPGLGVVTLNVALPLQTPANSPVLRCGEDGFLGLGGQFKVSGVVGGRFSGIGDQGAGVSPARGRHCPETASLTHLCPRPIAKVRRGILAAGRPLLPAGGLRPVYQGGSPPKSSGVTPPESPISPMLCLGVTMPAAPWVPANSE